MSKEIIYREDAIDAVISLCDDCDSDYCGYCRVNIDGGKDARKVLKDLPSAQPERAIKDCRNCKFGGYNDHWNTYFCYCSGDCNNWDKWEPSAQLEIIRCSECNKNYGSEHNPRCDYMDAHLWPDSFCSYGERKEDD